MKKLLFLLIIILYVSAVKAQNVGISSTVFTPQSLLHLYNPTDGNMLQISNTTAANSGFQVYMSGSDYSLINRETGFLSFSTDDTERMRILSDGNVGINVQAPATTFHVRLTGTTDFVTIDRDVSGYGPIMDWYGYGQTHRLRLEYIDGRIYNFQTDDANRHIAFNPSGNFGINTGTVSPTANLHVNGTVRFQNLGAGTTETTALLMDANGNLVNRSLDAVAFNGYTETDPNAWKISGNPGTTNGTDFIGTTDAQALDFRTNNIIRARITTKGQIEVLNSGFSVFLGEGAGANDDLSWNNNTFVGYYSGFYNTTGVDNSTYGYLSMYNALSSNDYNVALGSRSMYGVGGNYSNSDYNIALGSYSLYSINGGDNNIAMGYRCMYSLTGGNNNLAIGDYALYSNVSIGANIAIGSHALYYLTGGANNTAVGGYALYNTTLGYHNTAFSGGALRANITGNYNTAIGEYTIFANTNGSFNTALGYQAFITGMSYSNSMALGYNSNITASNMIRLGNISVSTIGGYANWTMASDKRFKTNIQENVQGINFIMKLRPVTYQLDIDAIAYYTNVPDSVRLNDAEKIRGAEIQCGFIAQEVEQAAKECGFDFSGVDAPKNENDYYGLRYAEFVVPLVQATQEQQNIIEQQQKTIESQQEQIDEMQKRLEVIELLLTE
jgi:hypothetical protein